jgi:nitroimidazol reductase NimA-like FMN-containing flavoprotein (pyridoxamine 5'-phosphate oxidase superfamily)
MLRSMDQAEMEQFLRAHYHGHLGCCRDNEPYVVPISYAYHEGNLLCYTHPGRKVEMLRDHPRACVQVDEVGQDGWTSVIVYGTYEELDGEARTRAIAFLGREISKVHTRTPAFLREELVGLGGENQKNPPILYRIAVTEMTGRMCGKG